MLNCSLFKSDLATSLSYYFKDSNIGQNCAFKIRNVRDLKPFVQNLSKTSKNYWIGYHLSTIKFPNTLNKDYKATPDRKRSLFVEQKRFSIKLRKFSLKRCGNLFRK